MDKNKKPFKRISLEKVITTSFLVDISDVVINVVVVFLSGSVTMLSQALEGGSDLLSSGLLLIGVKLSKRSLDQKHPYGHGREIYFWTFVSGFVTFGITATLSFYWGLHRFLHPAPIRNLPLAYFALIVAAFTNGYAFSLSYRRLLGEKSLSRFWRVFLHSALIETKTALVLDLMGTVASILGLIALLIYGVTGNLRFDGIGAMAIGLSLAFFAFFILKGSKELLVGQSAPPEVEEEIKKAALSFPQVKSVLDLRTIFIGLDKLLVNMEVHLKDGLITDDIEILIDEIEEKIRKQIPTATHIQIELETPDV